MEPNSNQPQSPQINSAPPPSPQSIATDSNVKKTVNNNFKISVVYALTASLSLLLFNLIFISILKFDVRALSAGLVFIILIGLPAAVYLKTKSLREPNILLAFFAIIIFVAIYFPLNLLLSLMALFLF